MSDLHVEEQEVTDYPEGGLEAWLVVLGAWCAMIPSMGLLNTLGTLHAWTGTHQLQDYSESSIGWIYGAYAFFLYFFGAQAGPIFDCYGPAYVVIPGSVGMVASILFFSFSTGMLATMLSSTALTSHRILPNLPLVQRPGRPFSMHPLQPGNRCNRPLV
jgi:MFS family permease